MVIVYYLSDNIKVKIVFLYYSLINIALQDNGGNHTVYGQWLGWLMAAIYMGGRIPQIVLNVSHLVMVHQ